MACVPPSRARHWAANSAVRSSFSADCNCGIKPGPAAKAASYRDSAAVGFADDRIASSRAGAQSLGGGLSSGEDAGSPVESLTGGVTGWVTGGLGRITGTCGVPWAIRGAAAAKYDKQRNPMALMF